MNVVDIGEFRLTRLSARPEPACKHLHCTLDDVGDVVTCTDCNKQVSAVWLLSQLARSGAAYGLAKPAAATTPLRPTAVIVKPDRYEVSMSDGSRYTLWRNDNSASSSASGIAQSDPNPGKLPDKLNLVSDLMRAIDAYAYDYRAGGKLVPSRAAVERALLAAIPPAPSSLPPNQDCHGLDTPERVRFYEHDFYPLSNFSAFRVHGWGRDFDTSEHAYHWHKFPDRPDIQDNIQCAASAHEAFKYAERMKPHRRPDWDDVKVDVMRRIIRAKADQHEYVRRKLLATGARELVEDSWRDDFWGWGPDQSGQNMLGKLWMELRAELRAAERAAVPDFWQRCISLGVVVVPFKAYLGYDAKGDYDPAKYVGLRYVCLPIDSDSAVLNPDEFVFEVDSSNVIAGLVSETPEGALDAFDRYVAAIRGNP